ncbi:hypothetical protein [Corynebacterium uterequi]|uniref:Uncharacterized protein n=1 Tax=Corynebacterium uterequi TaxID=1072256 RepID=A0A0G3HFM5_9CORY|nr:hypothetical protein [Corynebacterium uterequi]AKK11565.1 hypothetical protein CUTER_07900 [Corynebacterium uterequi]
MTGRRNQTPDPPDYWVWSEGELRDSNGELIAFVKADLLTYGEHRIFLEHTTGRMRFRLRATSNDGTFARIAQPGMTINVLHAKCGDRSYTLERTHLLRKERVIRLSDGRVAASVRPRAGGRVDVLEAAAYGEMPVLDAVFLSWACVMADVPRRTLRL